jgi:hypothetical protein
MIIRHGGPGNGFSESTDTFVVIIEGGGDNTVRPASPEMMEHWRRRREKEAELRKLVVEYRKQQEQHKQPEARDSENPPPQNP